ncbi:MAG: TonB-dependent receptor plug domain-containing protein [Kaistella sp.]|nr:TonB-dependent receptor plug domain-containing protein [Kaistella sp.]
MQKIIFASAFLLFGIHMSAQQDTVQHEREDVIEEVILKSTRSSRTIANTPTRVETISLEEIDEKSNMRPSNVAMILHESTGIAVQQTSATSANASIRIQGLDGRYTQILKDGLPSFGNFANGLSVLEIPPLDLKQVEIIKGPSSTLYGAGAIAGVINFISRTPNEKQDLNVLVNTANTGLYNVGVFSSQRYKKVGYTFLALYNDQKEYDIDKDDFTELPNSKEFTVHPKMFVYLPGEANLVIGNAFTTGNRLGGDVEFIRGNGSAEHTYFERNRTFRNTATLEFSKPFSETSRIDLKSAYSLFDRTIEVPNYSFKGLNQNYYSDLSWSKTLPNQTLIIGANYVTDNFKDRLNTPENDLSFLINTGGAYIQHTWDVSEVVKFENGIRADVVKYGNGIYTESEALFLPKISMLLRLSPKWTSRIGGGLGYKTPTAFTEQTEGFQYQNLKPLSGVTSEKSIGGTADVNFKTKIGTDFDFSINQMFFYTRLNNSIILEGDSTAGYELNNTDKPLYSSGFETNAKLIYKDFLKFFAGYTYTDTKADYIPGDRIVPLVPAHRVNLILMAEKHDNYKTGLEAYYTDVQRLTNRSVTKPYWDLGFMFEKYFGRFSVFINIENFLDTRQSRFKGVVNGSHNAPSFDEIWTHTEGRTFNGGIKFKL